jgi:hypothetical protein
VAAVIGVGSAVYLKQDDAPIEEVSERVIEYQLRLPDGTIDLTPISVELLDRPD